MKKRALSLFLALILCLSFAAPALAEDNTRIPYAATGGNIYFNAETGEIVDCDYNVTAADIPSEINGVAVTGIGRNAFSACTSLTSVIIPGSVTSIGAFAFCGCDGLTSVTVPASVTNIELGAFSASDNLTDIEVAPDNLKYCAVDGVLLNKGKTLLHTYPSGRNGVYEIPAGVTSIGDRAFDNCHDLAGVTIPDSVTSIGQGAFNSCISLTSMTIPANVTSIENSAFMLCHNLSDITVADENQYFIAVDGVLFNKEKTLLYAYPGGRSGTYEIPAGVTSIGDGAFNGCTKLTNVHIPDSVSSIGNSTFSGCDHLTSVTIPDSVTSIGQVAFGFCSRLTNITIPLGVESIKTDTFFACERLTSITIPASVTVIEYGAFYGCAALNDVYYCGTAQQWQNISIASVDNSPLINATIHYNSTGPEPAKRSIAACAVSGIDANGYEYTGSAITVPGLTVKDGATVLTEGTDYTLTYKNNTAVGTATVTVTGMGNCAGTKDVTFTIAKAPLTITAKDKAITYGEAPANDGVSYTGFVNGETEAVISGLSYTYTYTQYGNVGSYAINPTGATADNYQISLKPGKLTVEKKTVGLSWKGHSGLYYDGQAKAVTATAMGLVNNDAVTVTVAGGTQKDAGSYTAKATGLSGAKAANYKLPDDGLTQSYGIAYALESVTVTPATVTATIDQSTQTIKLVGYRGENETVELTGLTLADGKVTVNGVTYSVDDSGVVVNESDAVLTEAPAQVEKPEDAEDRITDAVVEAINDQATGSEGLDSASAEYIFAEVAKDESINAVEVSVSIQPKDLTEISIKLEITPVVTYKSGEEVVKTETIPNDAIKAPVTVSVKLPAGIPTTGFFAKHYLPGGQIEYLKVTVTAGVASWQQSSFSEVELIADSRSATVNFVFENGSGQSVTYTAADIGKALPKDSKSGSSFLGWLIDGGTAAQTTLTDELLTALNGKTVEAVPSFRTTGGGFVPSGAVTKQPEKPANPFADVFVSDYYYDAVLWAVKEGVTAGMSETIFAPDNSCTRAQAVTFLWRAAGKPQATSAVNPFEDVTASDYYYQAVLWAVEQGIAAGVSETSFAPDATVTRAQMMTFMWRMAGKPVAGTGNVFSDVPAGEYYADAVAWAVEKGVTIGTGAATFSPADNCTRGQIVTFLYRNIGK